MIFGIILYTCVTKKNELIIISLIFSQTRAYPHWRKTGQMWPMRGIIYRQTYQKKTRDSPPHYRTAPLFPLWEGISVQILSKTPRPESSRKPETIWVFRMWGKIPNWILPKSTHHPWAQCRPVRLWRVVNKQFSKFILQRLIFWVNFLFHLFSAVTLLREQKDSNRTKFFTVG